jgi:MinD-like ATPase involved in chromosome partitioning or flagellar assembly
MPGSGLSTEPSIALVFSPDPWVEQLHRFLADHGGARVRQLVVDPAVLDDEEFDVLVTGDRWPSLTPALVGRMHARRVVVVGVFDPGEPAGKDHLLAVGADAVIAADAPPAEIAVVVTERFAHRAAGARARPAGAGSGVDAADGVAPTMHAPIVVTGSPGSGVTEVALALGVELAARGSTLLLDARLSGAGTSVRLGLPLAPNLRSAVDELLCGGDPAGCVLTLARSGLHVLTGFPNAASAGQVSAREVLDVVAALRPGVGRLVVLADGEVREALADDAALVLVTAPTPLGVARAAGALGELAGALPQARHVVVNRAPQERFRVAELRAELGALDGVASVHVVPDDPRVGDAAWDGVVVGDGPFARSVAALVGLLAGDAGSRRARRRRGGRS